MKKLFALLLMLTMVVVFSACSGVGTGEAQSADQKSASEEAAAEPEDTSTGTIGDFEVSIKNYELIQDDEGKDAVFITFDFTNNGEGNANFDTDLYAECFQNGVELDFATIYNGERDDSYDNKYKDIQPGTTIEVKEAFLTQDKENPLSVKVLSMGEIMGGDSEGTVEKEFSITE